ncbi:hypothetical protein PROPEN_03452 [Proteus penneri ATCC 35198]|nr:hypothetical protein PROPEN_03452 [Proteus penneri ATCC 35198]
MCFYCGLPDLNQPKIHARRPKLIKTLNNVLKPETKKQATA